MKYCIKCGTELDDDAIVCIGCGCLVGQPDVKEKKEQINVNTQENQEESYSKIKRALPLIFAVFRLFIQFTMLFCKKTELTFIKVNIIIWRH